MNINVTKIVKSTSLRRHLLSKRSRAYTTLDRSLKQGTCVSILIALTPQFSVLSSHTAYNPRSTCIVFPLTFSSSRVVAQDYVYSQEHLGFKYQGIHSVTSNVVFVLQAGAFFGARRRLTYFPFGRSKGLHNNIRLPVGKLDFIFVILLVVASIFNYADTLSCHYPRYLT